MKLCIKLVSFIMPCMISSVVWSQTNTKVIGKLKGLKAGTVIYLSPSNSSSKKDSVVAEKGRFEFNLMLDEGDRYELKIGKERSGPGNFNWTNFYLQPGKVKIKGTAIEMYNVKLSGSKFVNEQNALKNYIKDAAELKKYDQDLAEMREALKAKDTAKMTRLRSMYFEREAVLKEIYSKWVLDHPSSPVSALVLWLNVNEKNVEKLQQHLDRLHPEAKRNALAKQMQDRIEKSKFTAVGKVAPDFVQNDTSGKAVSLKDFRGKYVLIDFWASWCKPCREDNPNLVKAYNNLKDKNFTILGVSLDQPNAKEKWLKAIHDDKLTWNHVSDLKYWNNAVARLYGIKSVPANLLIGPNGVILAKNLSGEYLDVLLGKYIK